VARRPRLADEHPTERLRAIARKRGASIILDDKRSWEHALAQLPDGPVVVRVEPTSEARSLELNRAYWGTLQTIVRQLDNAGLHTDAETIHKENKERFGIETTKNLPPVEMLDLLDRIRAHFASEYGVEFPPQEAILEDEPEPSPPEVDWNHL
jgi:dihydroxyacid dehydratase/phosphogluconate dehydratase